jgi:hypothetical protein
VPLEAGLGAFSRRLEPTAVPAFIRSSSSLSWLCRLRPQTLQATKPTPARRIAPPTPTTTPMMVFFALLLRPVLELEDPELRAGDAVLEVEDEVALDVKVCATTVPLMVSVVVTSTSD